MAVVVAVAVGVGVGGIAVIDATTTKHTRRHMAAVVQCGVLRATTTAAAAVNQLRRACLGNHAGGTVDTLGGHLSDTSVAVFNKKGWWRCCHRRLRCHRHPAPHLSFASLVLATCAYSSHPSLPRAASRWGGSSGGAVGCMLAVEVAEQQMCLEPLR